eukprot:7963319-Alexandrium_andersonii.AAC.1
MAIFHHFARDASRRVRLASGLPAHPKINSYLTPSAPAKGCERGERTAARSSRCAPLALAHERSCPRALQVQHAELAQLELCWQVFDVAVPDPRQRLADVVVQHLAVVGLRPAAGH